MKNIYLIGDLARVTDLSVDTLNYYLRIELIDEVARSQGNNYRLFDDTTVNTVEKIKNLRLKKVPIKEILKRKKNGIL